MVATVAAAARTQLDSEAGGAERPLARPGALARALAAAAARPGGGAAAADSEGFRSLSPSEAFGATNSKLAGLGRS